MHMVQHLLIADIAAILLTLGLTRHILRPATRRIHRIERAAGPFASPWFGVVAYVGAMWLWHVPALYDAALDHSVRPHARAPHASPPPGLLYWWHLLSPDPLAAAARRHGADRLHGARRSSSSACSASLLAFAPELLYDAYDHRRHALGHDRARRPAASPG